MTFAQIARRAGLGTTREVRGRKAPASGRSYTGFAVSLFCGPPLAEDVGDVLVIFAAEVLHDIGVLQQGRLPVHRERPGISAGIVDGDLVAEVPCIWAPIALDYVELLCVWVTDAIEPELIIESDRVHNEGVSLPLSSGIAKPRWIEVLGVAAGVHEDLPVGVHVPLDQDHYQ